MIEDIFRREVYMNVITLKMGLKYIGKKDLYKY